MSLYAVLRADGRLTDARDWSDAERAGRTDLVPLRAPPAFVGPAAYDTQAQLAVPATLTADERADRARLPARVLAALVVEARPLMFTAPERDRAKQILDAAAAKVREALRA